MFLVSSCGGEKKQEEAVAETELAEIDDADEEKEEVERVARPCSVHKVAPITEELKNRFRKFEKDLIEGENDYAWEENFSSMILENPATLYYPFDSLGGVDVVTSSDGRFRGIHVG